MCFVSFLYSPRLRHFSIESYAQYHMNWHDRCLPMISSVVYWCLCDSLPGLTYLTSCPCTSQMVSVIVDDACSLRLVYMVIQNSQTYYICLFEWFLHCATWMSNTLRQWKHFQRQIKKIIIWYLKKWMVTSREYSACYMFNNPYPYLELIKKQKQKIIIIA